MHIIVVTLNCDEVVSFNTFFSFSMRCMHIIQLQEIKDDLKKKEKDAAIKQYQNVGVSFAAPKFDKAALLISIQSGEVKTRESLVDMPGPKQECFICKVSNILPVVIVILILPLASYCTLNCRSDKEAVLSVGTSLSGLPEITDKTMSNMYQHFNHETMHSLQATTQQLQ